MYYNEEKKFFFVGDTTVLISKILSAMDSYVIKE